MTDCGRYFPVFLYHLRRPGCSTEAAIVRRLQSPEVTPALCKVHPFTRPITHGGFASGVNMSLAMLPKDTSIQPAQRSEINANPLISGDHSASPTSLGKHREKLILGRRRPLTSTDVFPQSVQTSATRLKSHEAQLMVGSV